MPEEVVHTRRGDVKVGDMIADRYEILRLLGEGGMGLVYKARHVLMNRFVAIKMIKSELVVNLTTMQRFQQEAQAVSKLQHANIVTVYDFGVTPEGTPYLVMDYLDGRSFADIIAMDGKVPHSEALDIFIQSCLGLKHAHDKGIIHRDFKSSNLMICKNGDANVVKVVDFGMAKLMRPDREDPHFQELTQTGEIFGSPLYMSPEQCRGQRLDERSDIYSLACVMYYALTGSPPLLGENVLDTLQRQIHDDPPAMKLADPDIPADLEAIIMKALRKNPEDRYQNASEVLADLQAVAAGRQRVYATVQMKKPDLTKVTAPRKKPVFSHNFETNMIVVLTVGAVIIAMTAYMTGRYVEEVGEAHELNMWVDRNNAGDKARRRGKFTDAERYYKEAVSEAMKFGRNDPRLAKSLVSLGSTYLEHKQYDRAETQLKRACTVLEKCYGANCAELAPVLMLLSRNYSEQGRKKDAALVKSRAMALIDPPKSKSSKI